MTSKQSPQFLIGRFFSVDHQFVMICKLPQLYNTFFLNNCSDFVSLRPVFFICFSHTCIYHVILFPIAQTFASGFALAFSDFGRTSRSFLLSSLDDKGNILTDFCTLIIRIASFAYIYLQVFQTFSCSIAAMLLSLDIWPRTSLTCASQLGFFKVIWVRFRRVCSCLKILYYFQHCSEKGWLPKCAKAFKDRLSRMHRGPYAWAKRPYWLTTGEKIFPLKSQEHVMKCISTALHSIINPA